MKCNATMQYNPRRHNRRSVRLKGYDYSKGGMYFITICIKDRHCFFGKIEDGKMILNETGSIANKYLQEIPDHYPHTEMGEYIVMPNHVHLVLILKQTTTGDVTVGTRHDVGTRHGVSLPTDVGDDIIGTRHGVSLPRDAETHTNQFGKPIAGSVSMIMNQYKSSVKQWCNNNGCEYFQWQSRFYDHVIRDEKSFKTISNYIKNNPANWNEDILFL